MPDLEKSHDKMSENFSKMTPAMRRHLTMHLSYLQSDCKKDALDDPLFHLNVMALNEFYQLNAFCILPTFGPFWTAAARTRSAAL